MASLAFIILFTAFYMFYCTSKKATIILNFGIENWVKRNTKPAKIIGLLLLIIAISLYAHYFGIGVGILLFFIVLMTLGSLIIILSPLKLLNIKTTLLLFAALVVIEFLAF